MANEEEPTRTRVASITPFESALKTFVGRDENGAIYSRLEYMMAAGPVQRDPDRPGLVVTQMDVVPNIIRGIIARLETDDPDYVERLISRIGSRAIHFDQASEDTSELDSEEYRQALAEQLADASSIHDFTPPLISAALFTASGELSPRKLKQKLAIAKNIFPDDPLIRLSREASGILSGDGLDQLGSFVLATSAALVEFTQDTQTLPLRDNDPNAAA